MTSTVNTRGLVLDMLMEILEKGEFSHLILHAVLEKYDYLPERDKHFMVRLTRGTIEKMLELDDILNQISKTKVKKMKPVIREILRMSLYQLRFMDHIPDSAVVNEAVKLTKKRGFPGLKGFVNAVLRTYIRRMTSDPLFPSTLEAKTNIPNWILDLWQRDYGESIRDRICQGFSDPAPLSIRTNEGKIRPEILRQRLESQGMTLTNVDRAELFQRRETQDQSKDGDSLSDSESGIFLLEGGGSLSDLPEFQEGDFYIQDLSSMLPAEAAGIRPGKVVIDLCAAPGGKSIDAALIMGDEGEILSRDLTEEKVEKIRENAVRLGLTSIRAEVGDATVHDKSLEGRADFLLADLPCSGLGVLRRKPEIRYRLKEEDIRSLQMLQRKILLASLSYLKEGGKLVYSTCTIDQAENQENRDWILQTWPDLTLIEERQILPDLHHDGFYYAVFSR
ncbi:16S rRNA (cytosine(967)-C(5))-methyltransferase RsmB [Lachnospiraceae bacterium YH-ros2228]